MDYYEDIAEQPMNKGREDYDSEAAPYRAPDSLPLEPLLQKLPAEVKEVLDKTLGGQFRKARKYCKEDWIS